MSSGRRNRSSSGLVEEKKKAWALRVSEVLVKDGVKELEARYRGMMKVHLLKHNRDAAERVVVSKSGYWLGQKEPTASTSVGRCRACEYNSVCEKSLFKPLGPRTLPSST